MTSVQSFDTDYLLQKHSDTRMCKAIIDLEKIYNEENAKLSMTFFHPNELRYNTYAPLDQLYFDDPRPMQRGLCDANIILKRQGNNIHTRQKVTPFILRPCANTKQKYVNSLTCNKEMCCTERHEAFNNLTRRI